VGIWRDRYSNGRRVDGSGTLFGRHEFSDIVGFKEALLKEKDRFSKAFTEHLLSYALGRPTTVDDAPAVEEIAQRVAQREYRFQALIEQIVLSKPFRGRESPADEEPAQSPVVPASADR